MPTAPPEHLIAAFPRVLADEVIAAEATLPRPTHPMLTRPIGPVNLDHEPLRIPFRTYFGVQRGDMISGHTPRERIAACILTRHHDGFVRQAALTAIASGPEPWIVPYMLQLVGEYVVEIIEDVARHRERLTTSPALRFVRDNPTFMALTRQRAISYWNCYYRRAIARRSDYPALRILDALERAAST